MKISNWVFKWKIKFHPIPKNKRRFSVEILMKLIILWYILIKIGMLLATKLNFHLHLKNVLDNVNTLLRTLLVVICKS